MRIVWTIIRNLALNVSNQQTKNANKKLINGQGAIPLIVQIGDMQIRVWVGIVRNPSVKFLLGARYIDKSTRSILPLDCNRAPGHSALVLILEQVLKPRNINIVARKAYRLAEPTRNDSSCGAPSYSFETESLVVFSSSNEVLWQKNRDRQPTQHKSYFLHEEYARSTQTSHSEYGWKTFWRNPLYFIRIWIWIVLLTRSSVCTLEPDRKYGWTLRSKAYGVYYKGI